MRFAHRLQGVNCSLPVGDPAAERGWHERCQRLTPQITRYRGRMRRYSRADESRINSHESLFILRRDCIPISKVRYRKSGVREESPAASQHPLNQGWDSCVGSDGPSRFFGACFLFGGSTNLTVKRLPWAVWRRRLCLSLR